jgi:dienelactone hydrolase
MRHNPWLLLLALIAATSAWAQQAPDVHLYDRDASQLLNAEVKLVEDTADWALYHVAYDSTRGQRVPALLGLPKAGAAPYPLLLLQHGLGGDKNVDYVRLPALELAKVGYATLRMDAHSHGERAVKGAPDSDNMVARVISMVQNGGWAQSVVDLRRGLDYCASRPDVDMTRVGYMGVSMGAIMGGVLCGVDDRIDAAVLLLGGSLGVLLPGFFDAIDPVHYIAGFAPRPLLMLNGKQDPLITPAAAQRLFDAAGEPKRIVWYETTHTLPQDEAVKEVTTFLAQHVPAAKPQ